MHIGIFSAASANGAPATRDSLPSEETRRVLEEDKALELLILDRRRRVLREMDQEEQARSRS